MAQRRSSTPYGDSGETMERNRVRRRGPPSLPRADTRVRPCQALPTSRKTLGKLVWQQSRAPRAGPRLAGDGQPKARAATGAWRPSSRFTPVASGLGKIPQRRRRRTHRHQEQASTESLAPHPSTRHSTPHSPPPERPRGTHPKRSPLSDPVVRLACHCVQTLAFVGMGVGRGAGACR
ncbi:hypothetical protein HJG60_009769 [Phyllostomus discolor]|uniref:Uncharacterized protein n=1 Tax=Phyllostomus discolor TaxID=89673 RepID=A0A834B9Y3_9CHIR|nr:hypothetical protein HJG60_009769 [Phyllostomus discolor]